MKSTKCQNCGLVAFSATGNCKRCGATLSEGPAFAPPNTNYGSAPQTQKGRKKGLAIFAFVLGIICFATVGMLGVIAVPGLIVAVLALYRAHREPSIYGGRGFGIAGLVLNVVALGLWALMGMIGTISVPNYSAARMAANEASAIQTLRTISSAQATYQSNFQRLATLEELVSKQLIDPNVAIGPGNGYRFVFRMKKSGDKVSGFEVLGIPVTYQESGTRSFFVDESMVIRGGDNQGRPSTSSDPPLPADSDSFRQTAYQDQ